MYLHAIGNRTREAHVPGHVDVRASALEADEII